jgi:hypothetical protein
MCRLKIVFCNFGLVVKLAPLAVKSVFACYHYADYLSTVKPNPHISANITSLPQPAPIILPQTTDHSTDQIPFNITTSGSNSGNTGNNSTYFPVQIGSSLDQMHTPHQMVGINCSSYIFQPRFAHRDAPNRTILIYFKSS